MLTYVPSFLDKQELFIYLQLYSFPKKIIKKLFAWDYDTIIFSALFFYLEKRQKEEKEKHVEKNTFLDFLTFSDWILILSLIFSPLVSDQILFFLEENNFLVLLAERQNKENLVYLFKASNYSLALHSKCLLKNTCR